MSQDFVIKTQNFIGCSALTKKTKEDGGAKRRRLLLFFICSFLSELREFLALSRGDYGVQRPDRHSASLDRSA